MRYYQSKVKAYIILVVKKYIEEFKFQNTVDQFTAKYTQPPPKLE